MASDNIVSLICPITSARLKDPVQSRVSEVSLPSGVRLSYYLVNMHFVERWGSCIAGRSAVKGSRPISYAARRVLAVSLVIGVVAVALRRVSGVCCLEG